MSVGKVQSPGVLMLGSSLHQDGFGFGLHEIAKKLALLSTFCRLAERLRFASFKLSNLTPTRILYDYAADLSMKVVSSLQARNAAATICVSVAVNVFVKVAVEAE